MTDEKELKDHVKSFVFDLVIVVLYFAAGVLFTLRFTNDPVGGFIVGGFTMTVASDRLQSYAENGAKVFKLIMGWEK